MVDLFSKFFCLIVNYPHLLITLTIWITYCYSLKTGFVSDDYAGLLNFDGLLQTRSSEKVNADTKLTTEQKVKEVEKLNKRSLIARLCDSEYGMISRWLRYTIAGGNKPSKVKIKNPNGTDTFLAKGKIPLIHHVYPIVIVNVSLLILYRVLSPILGARLVLLSVLLFAVHPVGTQAIAWCSALGYPFCLLWISMMLGTVQWYYAHHSVGNSIVFVLGYCLLQFLGIHAQFIPMMTCFILLLLGYWHFAVLGFVISSIMVWDIIKQTIDLRVASFKEQHMEASTYMKPAKIIVATKTFLYYLGLSLVPRRMGLYHEWGFHYKPEIIEKPDKLFFLGLLGLLGLTAIFFLTDVFAIKFAILWFCVFIFIFLNWITIQQFVTERYVFIPTFGTCLLIAYFTRNYLWIYALIFGIYLCRTWMQLPTYDDELRFYLSNTWQFKRSEVAYGNLGVTYMNHGFDGAAKDSWRMSSLLNPNYDVPAYNLFSIHKTEAIRNIQSCNYTEALTNLHEAKPFIELALKSTMQHYPKMWEEEHKNLMQVIKNPSILFQQELARLYNLRTTLNQLMKEGKDERRRSEVQISIDNNESQVLSLLKFMREQRIDTSVVKLLAPGEMLMERLITWRR